MASINRSRLQDSAANLGVDVLVAAAPENTYYLSGVFIRTQVSIRDRLAVVVWPTSGAEPTFVVCNIEESLARTKGDIEDVRSYVEFEESPVSRVSTVLRDSGWADARIGIERRFLTADQVAELSDGFPSATFVAVDDMLESVRSVKTDPETVGITYAYRQTEAAIREAWRASAEGESEWRVARRLLDALLDRGSDGVRHMTMAAGENTVHPHLPPSAKELMAGETVLTDVGAYFDGYASDIARMGVVGSSPEQADAFRRYWSAYSRFIQSIRPGVTAGSVYELCREEFLAEGLRLTAPHVGHGVSRMGGHEQPILRPGSPWVLEPGMLLAVEPSIFPWAEQRYHLEDLVRITPEGSDVLTDWRSAEVFWQVGLDSA